jgi:uncharacterized membrane protein
MKSSRAAAFVLVLLYACFLGYWVWSGMQLPERVATHFNGSGEPNGWMSRSANQTIILIFGVVLPLFMIGLFFAARFLPAFLVNIPDRQYWLAPERKTETSDYLVRHSLWLACLLVGLMIGIQYSTVQANRQTPPHLSLTVFLQIMVSFVTGMAIWLLVLLRHFRKLLSP